LAPEIEQRLNWKAQQQGIEPADFVQNLLQRELTPKEVDMKAFLALPREEQSRLLRKAAEEAAPDYAADLALPAAERELTAFSAISGDAFHEY
jgi:hypothetical protein